MRVATLLLVSACARVAAPPAPVADAPIAVAFGSCNQQEDDQGFWGVIADSRPNLFVAAGDNVYGDLGRDASGRVRLLPVDLGRLDVAYATLAASPAFQRFRAAVPIAATWDDHDYGQNDAGAELPVRAASQARFLDFWQVPADDPRRSRDGVYTASILGDPDARVQVVLLDTRSFRGPLATVPAPPGELGVRYRPSDDSTSSMLGEAQWAWLEGVLREPAAVRLVVSSIQVISEAHPFERWGNLPHERERLLALLARTGATNTVILSGDRHVGGLYELAQPWGTLVELTSSSLNRSFRADEVDPSRVGPLVGEDNFGWVRVDPERRRVRLELRSADDGRTLLAHDVALPAPR